MLEVFSDAIILEMLALCAFVFYIYFSFCDGFGLSPIRKLVWAVWFMTVSLWTLDNTGHFDLRITILWSSLAAFLLGKIQKKDSINIEKK